MSGDTTCADNTSKKAYAHIKIWAILALYIRRYLSPPSQKKSLTKGVSTNALLVGTSIQGSESEEILK